MPKKPSAKPIQNQFPVQKQTGFEAYVSSLFYKHEDAVAPHGHEGYELIYYLEGSCRIKIGKQSYLAAAGDLVFFHPGVVHHEFRQPGPCRLLCLRFLPGEFGMEIPFPGPGDLEPVLHLPWRERFHNIIEQIILEHNGLDEWSKTLTATYMMQFVILLWRALSYYQKHLPNKTKAAQLRIGNIIELIHSRINTDVSLAELANQACLSESRLSHVFKDVTGLSPKQYMITGKMEKARELLSMTADSISRIAATLGYDDPAYFCRLFKKESGLTPGLFRQKSKKVQ